MNRVSTDSRVFVGLFGGAAVGTVVAVVLALLISPQPSAIGGLLLGGLCALTGMAFGGGWAIRR